MVLVLTDSNHWICGKFVEIYHDGIHPVIPPGKTYFGLVDSGDWYEVETMPEETAFEAYNFDYAPTRNLNEILKSISE